MTVVGAGQLEQVRVRTSAVAAPRKKPFPWQTAIVHALLIACIAVVAFPLYYAFVISTQNIQEVIQRPPLLYPSSHLLENYMEAWRKAHMGRMLFNSLVMGVTVAVGKIVISMLSAFAVVYFDFRGRMLCFWMIFLTLMLPVPVRIMSTYEVVGTLGWLNTYQGLTIPLFLFQFLLPLSWANIAALFVVLFIFGWNQYFWPILITNTEAMRTVVIGLEELIPRSGTELPTWNLIMAGAVMALMPPVAVILFMQRWFVKGLVESEK